MEEKRVVQIRTANKELFSGYLIAPGLILTCRHGLKNVATNEAVFVRGLADLKKDPQDPRFGGTVLWKGTGVDAALIAIPKDHPVNARQTGTAPVPFAQLTSSRVCRGIGFPNSVATGNNKDNNNYDFSGQVQRMAIDGDLLLDFVGKLPDPDQWRGLSGSAVLCGKALVGVVRETFKNLGGGGLRAEAVDTLFQDQTFLQHAATYHLTPPIPYLAAFDVSRMRSYVCNVDRRKAAEIVKTHFSAKRWPAIVVVSGASRQKHERFIERLARFEMKDLLEEVDIAPERIFPGLGWPEALHINSADSLQSWLKQEWKRFGPGFTLPDKLDDVDACADALAHAIDQTVGPHGFWVSINTNTAEAGSGHGAFLEKWGGLWRAVQQRGVGRPFAIFLCLVDDEPAAPAPPRMPWSKAPAPSAAEAKPIWLDALTTLFSQGAIYGDEELRLDDIPFEEIRRWIIGVRELVQQELEAPAIYCEDIDEMAEHLKAKHAGRAWSMAEFDDHTNTFFNGRRS